MYHFDKDVLESTDNFPFETAENCKDLVDCVEHASFFILELIILCI